MKYETLKQRRLITPGVIGAALTFPAACYVGLSKEIPWGWVSLGAIATSVVYAAIYDGLAIRKLCWDFEQRDYVGEQIKGAMLDLVPKDLILSSDEVELIRQRTEGAVGGLFWSAIDSDAILKQQKEMFYEVGYAYSTCFDVLILGFFLGLANIVAFAFTEYVPFVLGGIAGMIAAFFAFVFIPRYRKQMLQISREQLVMLRELKGEELSRKLREILAEYRISKQLAAKPNVQS